MSLNEMKLPPQLVVQLYQNSLVANEVTEVIIDTGKKGIKEIEWKYLGGNKRNVLVVVDYIDMKYLPDDQIDFLTQLLKACKLSLDDIALINWEYYKKYSYADILSHFGSTIILLFDVNAAGFGFPFEIPQYQVQHFTHYKVMHAPAMHQLKNDKPAKGKLWASLQKIFDL